MGFKDRYQKPEEKKDPIIEETKQEIIEPKKKAPVKRATPEEIITTLKKKIRKRDLKKDRPYINISIMGDTIEVKEFRAICKKNGWQMNNTLKKILHEWNTANYNL